MGTNSGITGSVRLDHTVLALESEHVVYGMFELEVAAPPSVGERPPLAVAVVVDRSGSMGGPKLETTKACVAWLIRRLRADDQLALIAYDDAVRILAPLGPVGNDRLIAAVAAIHAGGSTNLSGGWLKAVEELRRAGHTGVRKVVLLTDGLANVGIVDRPTLTTLAGSAAGEGIGTTTIGFGRDFDEDLLTAMSDAGRGNAHYIATPDDAPSVFANEVDGLMTLIAQNVSVEIRPANDVDVVGVLNEYPVVGVAGGLQIQMGDAYGGERRHVIFEMHVPGLDRIGPAVIATIVLRYVSVGSDIVSHEVTIPVTVNLATPAEAAAVGIDATVSDQVVIMKAARARTTAVELADRGDQQAAKAALRAAPAGRLKGAPVSPNPDELRQHAVELAASVEAMDAYDAAERKQLRYQAHQTQRSRRPKL